MLRGKAVTLLGDNIARGTENLSKWEHDWLCCLNKSPRSCNWDFLFSLWLWLFSLILWCFFQWLWRRLGLHFHEFIFHLVHHNSFPTWFNSSSSLLKMLQYVYKQLDHSSLVFLWHQIPHLPFHLDGCNGCLLLYQSCQQGRWESRGGLGESFHVRSVINFQLINYS